MKKTLRRVVTGTMAVLLPIVAQSQQLAFPGAEGFGKYATGGRKGSVYHVTNLNDSGTGSFRDAVSQSNRIVVFDVAGVINISSRISVKSNIYIAGQTAPGEGITIYGDGLSFSGASNTICRYLRVRMGKVGTDGADAIGIDNGSNMIFDHVSVAWGRDETFSISGSNPENITIQNCIISQGLMGHSAGGLVQTEKNVSIYRTLYIHNDTRNPKFKGVHQYVNNIVYNWKTAAYIMGGDSEGTSYANAVGNLFITGPTGKSNAFSGANERYNIYTEDNLLDANQDGVLNPQSIPQSDYEGGPTFQSQPYDYPILPTVEAANLLDSIVATVGASLPYRDNLDWLLIRDLQSLGTKGEIISNEADLEIGAPSSWSMWSGSTDSDDRKDSDGDGMPDWWEDENGTDASTNDAMTLRDGYANIEHYINSITEKQSQYFLKSPLALQAEERKSTEILLSWLDFTNFEDGYIVEQEVNGNYTEVTRTNANISAYTVTGLTPETTYKFRVKAYNQSGESDYSNVLEVKTKAIPINVVDPDTYIPDFTWTGVTSSVWDTVTSNWNNGVYTNGKNVLFDTQGAGTITIASGTSMGDVFVTGDKDYTLSGTLAGTGSLNKTGKGTLVLDDNNTYSGGTVVWDGTLEIGKLANGGSASSIGTAQNWVWNGGKIRYTGSSVSTNREVALENKTDFEVANSGATVTLTGVVSGEGDFVKSGSGTVSSAFNLHTYTGNTIVKGGTYELKGKDLLGTEPGLHGKLILEGGTFKTTGGDSNSEGYIKFDVEVHGDNNHFHIGKRNNIKSKFSGDGNIQLDIEYLREMYQGDWSEFYGTVTANQKGSEGNQFHLDNAKYGGMPNARLCLTGKLEMRGTNGGTFYLGGLSGESSATLACCQIKKDGGTVTWIVGGLGTDETFNGKVTNGIEHSSRIGYTSIVKEGDGIWRLNGANKYRGSTTINGGTLIINGAHTQDKDYTNTYYTPDKYIVNNGGTLSGKGSTMAPLVVNNGGAVSPGDMGIGTLTIKNDVTLNTGSCVKIEINRSSKTCDKFSITGTMTIAGDLELTLTDGEYNVDDKMTILSAASYSGKFSNIEPQAPGVGLVWDTSDLYTSGVLKVIAESTALHNPDMLALNVYAGRGIIYVRGLIPGLQVDIYNTAGVLISSYEALDSEGEISVGETGIYIVKIGNIVKKVYVP